jgi:hypothetical protein
MERHCTVVFDLATAGFRAWPAVAAGVSPIIMLAVVIAITSRVRTVPVKLWITFVLAVLLEGTLFAWDWGAYRGALAALRTKHYETVEGPVENFVAEPLSGHGEESFTVGGRSFHYGSGVLTPGLHRSRLHGGPFAPGIYVRLRVRGNDILYAEKCESY